MHRKTLVLCIAASLAAGVFVAPRAHADSSSPVTPLMERAFAKLEQGPDHLRWFAYRTQIIYGLSAADIVAAYESRKSAAATPVPERSLASADTAAAR